MKNRILILALSVVLPCSISHASARSDIGGILTRIEANNKELSARREALKAQTIATRVGNSLENTEVEFGYMWDAGQSSAKSGDVTVKQQFDLPNVYVHRNKLALLEAQKYGYEYQAERQKLLLEAKTLCIEILSLRQICEYRRAKTDGAKQVMELTLARGKAGDANVLEENNAKFQYMTSRGALRLAEAELANAEQKLTNLNGGEPIELDGTYIEYTDRIDDFEQVLALYESSSPEMRSLLGDKLIAERDIKLSRSMSLPKISVGYRHSFATGGEKADGLVAGLSIPIFSNRNNVKRAKAMSEVAGAQYLSGVTDLRSNLTALYDKAEILSETMNEYNNVVHDNPSTLLLLKAFEAGQISIVDYYAQIDPIYDTYIEMVEIIRDYALICARINMINL